MLSPRMLAVAGVTLVTFVLLTLLVATGATDPADVAVRDSLRPDDVWGTVQVRADAIVEGLEPVRTLPVFAVCVSLVAWLRRSWQPVAYALALLAAAGLPALAVKATMGRTDPHRELSSLGSYPSGHVLVLLVCLGGLLLLARRSPRWWEWALVALVDLSMVLALLVQATHWFTDVVAGVLLGVVALVVTARLSHQVALRAPRRTAGRGAP
jgi:membrane-associated phospholipid phosphatase